MSAGRRVQARGAAGCGCACVSVLRLALTVLPAVACGSPLPPPTSSRGAEGRTRLDAPPADVDREDVERTEAPNRPAGEGASRREREIPLPSRPGSSAGNAAIEVGAGTQLSDEGPPPMVEPGSVPTLPTEAAWCSDVRSRPNRWILTRVESGLTARVRVLPQELPCEGTFQVPTEMALAASCRRAISDNWIGPDPPEWLLMCFSDTSDQTIPLCLIQPRSSERIERVDLRPCAAASSRRSADYSLPQPGATDGFPPYFPDWLRRMWSPGPIQQ